MAHSPDKEEQARNFFRAHVCFCSIPQDDPKEDAKARATATAYRDAFEKKLFDGIKQGKEEQK